MACTCKAVRTPHASWTGRVCERGKKFEAPELMDLEQAKEGINDFLLLCSSENFWMQKLAKVPLHAAILRGPL